MKAKKAYDYEEGRGSWKEQASGRAPRQAVVLFPPLPSKTPTTTTSPKPLSSFFLPCIFSKTNYSKKILKIFPLFSLLVLGPWNLT
jgi:hypothetical protein